MRRRLLIFMMLFVSHLSFTQEKDSFLGQEVSLEEAIELAKVNSIDYKTAKNSFDVSFWENRSFKTLFSPSVSMTGILPSYTNSINRITADDGSDIFISQNQAFSSISYNIEQNIPFTGGSLTLSTSLNRIDVFSNNLTRYSSTPFSINYFQESILYNSFKWEKKIQPLVFEESKRKFIEDLENISLDTSEKFFDYVLADIKYKNAVNNKANQDTIFKIAKGRFEIGKLYKNDLLQSELSLLNSEKDIVITKNNLKLSKRIFAEQVGLQGINLKLRIPENLILIEIDSTKLFDNALKNQALIIKHERKELEAQKEIARIKSDDVKIGLTGNFGLTQQGSNLSSVYNNLLRQENFSLSLSVPIFNWGKRDAEKKIAIANLDLVKSENSQELISFKRELELKFLKWKELKSSVKIAKRASDIAIERYNFTKNRFYLSKVSITDINIAQNEMDNAVYSYYEILKEYWMLYYEIRKLTLYDFVNNRKLELK